MPMEAHVSVLMFLKFSFLTDWFVIKHLEAQNWTSKHSRSQLHKKIKSSLQLIDNSTDTMVKSADVVVTDAEVWAKSRYPPGGSASASRWFDQKKQQMVAAKWKKLQKAEIRELKKENKDLKKEVKQLKKKLKKAELGK